jgi:hypothetical protein
MRGGVAPRSCRRPPDPLLADVLAPTAALDRRAV